MPYGHLNSLFMILCILLVLIMQMGFLCLEAGAVRSKNNVNVAAKNLMDLIMVAMVYFTISFTIQFGFFSELAERAHPRSPGYPYLFLIFQTLFAITATTIISGAVAERCSLKAYLIIALLVVGFIYPVAGQWIWGGLLGTEKGWLADLGFIDFAGSTLVHSIGGSVALAAIIIIGPRAGFGEASYKTFRGQNQVLSLLGVLMIWLGWFGFNMGSFLMVKTQLPLVLTNTFIGGCAGGLAATIWSYLFFHKFDIPVIANGVLAGLVGITAAAHILSPETAILAGFIAGFICCGLTVQMESFGLDDVVGAVPVHLGGGIWGTLVVALLGDSSLMENGNTYLEQLGIQCLGIVVTLAWSFGISFIVLKLIDHFYPLRVSSEEEQQGLNVSEHGSATELSDLIEELEDQAESGHFKPVIHAPFSELGGITRQYNRVLDRFLDSQKRLEVNIKTLKNIRDQLQMQKDKAESASRHKSIFLGKMSHEVRTPLNGIIATSDLLKTESLTQEQQEYVDVINQSGHALMSIINDVLDFSQIESGKLKLEEQPYNLKELLEQCMKVFQPEALSRQLNFELDIEMGTPVELTGDATRFRQVIINLINNAFKFTEKGEVTIRVSHIHSVNTVQINILDTGTGIPEDRLESIFDSFIQADNSHNRPHGGSGLGLAIGKQLIERMGGSISASNRPDGGSCFSIQMPLSSQL